MTLHVEKLGKETLDKLGVNLEPLVERSAKRHLALGMILKAIQKLDEDDVLWVLHETKTIQAKQGKIVEDEKAGNGYVAPLSWTVEVVAKAFHVGLSDMVGRRRMESIVLPRQVAMYILWMTQKYTLKQVGDALGGRSPATVSHGFDTVARALHQDKKLSRIVDEIQKELA